MSDTHPFDEAITLVAHPDGRQTGRTHAAYQNMVGPYGGITAAAMLQAVLNHPLCLGEPIALTVNYAGPVADGGYTVHAQPLRTNKSTQHWLVQMTQPDAAGLPQLSTSATVVTALRRSTWGAADEPLPTPLPAPEALPRRPQQAGGPAWLQRYDMRAIVGGLPTEWDGREGEGLSRMWVRDEPLRTIDFAGLAALADTFMPVIWLRRATRVLIGTVSMTVYFHASRQELADSSQGGGWLLAEARGLGCRNGFFDHTGQLWNQEGVLLASTQQIVYYKG